MEKINVKSLIFAMVLGLVSWIWAFMLIGSAMGSDGQFDFGMYMVMMVVNIILTIFIITVYLWKYEQKNPILSEKWNMDALLFGIVLCAMNFLLDSIFFGLFLQMNLISYFFFESTAGYFYLLLIAESIVIAYLVYGRKK